MRKLFTYFLLLAVSFGVHAQEVKFYASVNKKNVQVGERFQVSFNLDNAKGKSFDPPDFRDFLVYSGPSQSSNMQYVNGNFTQSISYSYILACEKVGKIQIGPAFVVAKGNQIRSEPITVNVSKGKPKRNRNGGVNNDGQKSQEEEIRDNISIKAVVSKSSPYQGEQLTLTYKLYTRLDILNYNLTKSPSFTGFWSQDIELPGQIRLSEEVVDGVPFRVGVLKKVALFPQRMGELVIDPMETEFTVRIRSKKKRRSLFDDFFNDPFFGMGTQNVNVKVVSNKVRINPKELPNKSKQPYFKGGVGKFSLQASLDNGETKANEPVTLKVKLSGAGNIKLLELGNIEFPSTLEVYDPKISDIVSNKTDIITGSRVFEYLLVPRYEGEHVISPINFTYFDPAKKEYVNLVTPEFIIRAAEGDEIQSAGPISGFRKEELELLGKDIRFIKTGDYELFQENYPLLGTTKFYALLLSPLVLLLLFLFFWGKYERSNANVAAVRSRRANKLARKHLSVAQRCLKDQQEELFYEEISKSLWGYIGDRLSIQAANLSADLVTEHLTSRNVSIENIEKFTSTIKLCEMARFAPSDGSQTMEQIYNDSLQLITNIENELKE
ncbi:protein BatD [bacterium AH-315-C07]|nr:protein BatD [bacterium AH-315-C07]